MTNIQKLQQTKIVSLSHEGRGVAHIDGKATFIDNALPGEEITFTYTRRRSKFDEATAVEILQASSDRVTPKCPHFGVCGGCSLQHLDHLKQIERKIANLKEHFKHFGGVEELNILPPIIGPAWHYRSRARLSVKYVQKKQRVLVGFHEKNGRYVAEIEQCPILPAQISNNLLALGDLIASLSIYQQIPQIELACGDSATALLFRHLAPLSADDLVLLEQFGRKHDLQIYLQPGGADSIRPLLSSQPATLSYKFPQRNLEMLFALTDFTQINREVNQQMVDLVLELLDIQPTEQILDLFCGIGNFTLPIAQQCQHVVGVEGNDYAIIRAKQNAGHNQITNAEFYCADLTKDFTGEVWAKRQYDKILLDPPRTGALEMCQKLRQFGAKKIVYVSCNHATLARDTKDLLQSGYSLQNVRVVNMFPHTAHIETIAVFSLKEVNDE